MDSSQCADGDEAAEQPLQDALEVERSPDVELGRAHQSHHGDLLAVEEGGQAHDARDGEDRSAQEYRSERQAETADEGEQGLDLADPVLVGVHHGDTGPSAQLLHPGGESGHFRSGYALEHRLEGERQRPFAVLGDELGETRKGALEARPGGFGGDLVELARPAALLERRAQLRARGGVDLGCEVDDEPGLGAPLVHGPREILAHQEDHAGKEEADGDGEDRQQADAQTAGEADGGLAQEVGESLQGVHSRSPDSVSATDAAGAAATGPGARRDGRSSTSRP